MCAATEPRAGIPILPAGFTNQTLREIVHTSIGGKVVRARLTNAYGTAALVIGAAHLAIRRIRATRPSSCRSTTAAITCTRTTPGTKRWPTPST
jgi:hypothetical protein